MGVLCQYQQHFNNIMSVSFIGRGVMFMDVSESFLAHLAFILPSLFVCRPSTFHILIFSSETAGPIAAKLWWNGPWMTPFQIRVRWSRLPTKMAAKLKIEKRGDEIKTKSSPLKLLANLNQTLLKWSLDGSLLKWCPAFQTSDQDGHHSRT